MPSTTMRAIAGKRPGGSETIVRQRLLDLGELTQLQEPPAGRRQLERDLAVDDFQPLVGQQVDDFPSADTDLDYATLGRTPVENERSIGVEPIAEEAELECRRGAENQRVQAQAPGGKTAVEVQFLQVIMKIV